jgi:hypothetical protein
MIKWLFLIMQLITSIIGIAFLLYGFFNNPFDFAYLFILFFFFVFATIFYMASDIIDIKEGIEENSRDLLSLDRKINSILDEFPILNKKVKKNATLKQK